MRQQDQSFLTNAVAEWHRQVRLLLPGGTKLGDIDSPPFSASTATLRAVLHLRTVQIPGSTNPSLTDEVLLDQLKTACAIDDDSLTAAQDMLHWRWPRPSSHHLQSLQPTVAPPHTPYGKQTRPSNAPPMPKQAVDVLRLRSTPEQEMLPPHHLFCTMLSDLKYRSSQSTTSTPDKTEAYTFAHALGPFGHPWIKYRRMDDSLDSQDIPPRFKPGPAIHPRPRRGLGLFQEQMAVSGQVGLYYCSPFLIALFLAVANTHTPILLGQSTPPDPTDRLFSRLTWTTDHLLGLTRRLLPIELANRHQILPPRSLLRHRTLLAHGRKASWSNFSST